MTNVMPLEPAATSDVANYAVYIMLSQTATTFGSLIRQVLGCRYNHASIAFDAELVGLYSFGRRRMRMPLIAGLIQEYPARFRSGRRQVVPVIIYRVPLTQEQYEKGLARIAEISSDEEGYLYNLFSVLSYPVLGGFATTKAYSCTEFVAHMVHQMEVPLTVEKEDYAYTPEELGLALDQQVYYEGDLLEYCQGQSGEAVAFFAPPHYLEETAESAKIVAHILQRMARSKWQRTKVGSRQMLHFLYLLLAFGLRNYRIDEK